MQARRRAQGQAHAQERVQTAGRQAWGGARGRNLPVRDRPDLGGYIVAVLGACPAHVCTRVCAIATPVQRIEQSSTTARPLDQAWPS